MTTSEIDRVMRLLTEMRVDQADRFARIEERIKSASELPVRVKVLEDKCAAIGKFGMGDVYRFIGAVAASAATASLIIRASQ